MLFLGFIGAPRTESLDFQPTDRIVNENNKIKFRAANPTQKLRIMNVPSVITVYSAEEGKMKRLQKFTIYRYACVILLGRVISHYHAGFSYLKQ